MAKDPAMLWYWGDWHSGTILLSRFLKGCYMDILHAQFNNGPLSLDEVKSVLGSDFNQSWAILSKKFSVNPEGLFFNERLEGEKLKRKNFVESRSNNKSGRKKKSYDKSYENHMNNHMNNHMENENINDYSSSVESKDCTKSEEGKFYPVPALMAKWMEKFPDYPAEPHRDYEPIRKMAEFICGMINAEIENEKDFFRIEEKFIQVRDVVAEDNFYSGKALSTIEKKIQEFYAKVSKKRKKFSSIV